MVGDSPDGIDVLQSIRESLIIRLNFLICVRRSVDVHKQLVCFNLLAVAAKKPVLLVTAQAVTVHKVPL